MSSSILFGQRMSKRLGAALWLAALVFSSQAPASAQTALADQPVLSAAAVPGNLVLPLSVEFPTGVSVAHVGNYDSARSYLGYFDPGKCYSYVYNALEPLRYFQPVRISTTRICTVAGEWSGNFLNWATMQTIDPFRWALTGGKRTTDDLTTTIIEKANASGQGGTGNFPDRSLTSGGLISDATPLAWNNLTIRIQGLGYRMRFTRTGNVYDDAAATAYNPSTPPAFDSGGVFEVSVRVRVCDPTTAMGVAGVETNCRLYGSNYKPEGLIQQYSDRIRYSAFGYLNDGNIQRDGAVLRARQKFVGPRTPVPNAASTVNANREWDAATGIQVVNPDTADATAFGNAVGNSGVINYLNKFGQTGNYKTYDPVGELYYAAIRYLKNQGNVAEWSNLNGGNANNFADGFPVITNWGDPIQYSCQSNFVLGIGDANTHADKNVPGPTGAANEGGKPAAVTADATVNAVAQTNAVGTLEGMGNAVGTIENFNGCCSNNSALMAGLAYDSHVRDIRPDLPETQTVRTFWVDVLEYSTYKKNNQFYLAAKYGGFTVPQGFNPDTVTAATFPGLASWNSNGQTLDAGNATSALPTGINVDNGGWGAGSNRRPDTYYTGGTPDSMVAGLTEAFTRISSDLRAATTSFSLSAPEVTITGNVSYSASYNSGSWTGTLSASSVNFNATTGAPTSTAGWTTDATLANQLAGNGWDTGRRVITYSGSAGIPFRAPAAGGISNAQLALLDTPYGAGVDGAQYLNYLRGERCNEAGATSAAYPTCPVGGTPLGYRARTNLLGDIAGSKVTAVAAPNARYSDAVNPGYSAFITAESARPRMVYVGANDGMLHAFNGELTGAAAGQEVFAYVPSALFSGPSTPATPATDGLVSRGNPVFEHRALVDSTPGVFDIDFARTGGPITGNPAPLWRSVLIGGLGKGGRSYYAINVTSPGAATNEAQWASRVLWEFPNASTPAAVLTQLGFTYGRPLVTKLAKYGWVVIFPSGYNNTAGGSYLFIVNPATGALLETITIGTVAQPSNGLAHVQGYQLDFANNTAESLYAGDLLGNVWRVDVRATSGAYPTPVNIARLDTPDGTTRQPVTTRLLVEVDPASGRRYVLVGTGRLLDTTDVSSTSPQSFYAIVDGTGSAFSTAATLPTGVTFPITRTNLVANTNATLAATGVTSTLGWYVDFGTGTGGRAWRETLDPATNAGRVLFTSVLPDGNVCGGENSTRRYEVEFGTGRSVQLDDAGVRVSFYEQAGVAIDARYLCLGTTCRGYVGVRGRDGTGSFGARPAPPPTLPGLRRLNWRELQIVQ